jgi:hypothetical protein
MSITIARRRARVLGGRRVAPPANPNHLLCPLGGTSWLTCRLTWHRMSSMLGLCVRVVGTARPGRGDAGDFVPYRLFPTATHTHTHTHFAGPDTQTHSHKHELVVWVRVCMRVFIMFVFLFVLTPICSCRIVLVCCERASEGREEGPFRRRRGLRAGPAAAVAAAPLGLM